MRIPIYQIDAFSHKPFQGNPAAVCILDAWLGDETLQNIAAENNLAETAFLVGSGGSYELRWFTPEVEVDLCGHATLASAYAVFRFLQPNLEQIAFSTMSGILTVTHDGDLLSMDFPARAPRPTEFDDVLVDALGIQPLQVLKSRDLLVLFEKEQLIRELTPNFEKLKQVKDGLGVIVTAPGDSCDFVSRFFAPKAGISEDPVTGSSHCTLVPFWATRLDKTRVHARQLSKRGGELFCRYGGDRVTISGHCALFLTGEISFD
jgi:PhzF family phenazine biosynthesis protein